MKPLKPFSTTKQPKLAKGHAGRMTASSLLPQLVACLAGGQSHSPRRLSRQPELLAHLFC